MEVQGGTYEIIIMTEYHPFNSNEKAWTNNIEEGARNFYERKRQSKSVRGYSYDLLEVGDGVYIYILSDSNLLSHIRHAGSLNSLRMHLGEIIGKILRSEGGIVFTHSIPASFIYLDRHIVFSFSHDKNNPIFGVIVEILNNIDDSQKVKTIARKFINDFESIEIFPFINNISMLIHSIEKNKHDFVISFLRNEDLMKNLLNYSERILGNEQKEKLYNYIRQYCDGKNPKVVNNIIDILCNIINRCKL